LPIAAVAFVARVVMERIPSEEVVEQNPEIGRLATRMVTKRPLSHFCRLPGFNDDRTTAAVLKYNSERT
jgi:hypothetical protein